ncbi:hypothetical protein M422DRAFT_47466 [Sphaerobolus stellatus SS14]|uniref:Uncharacterized protein n=1 Tax=Sphaerobolus stellatus (strain SS14) TaxID=990650 RepID=A0A0C9VBS0_SPHS4|nr:hypothetical protein M422DRAFT_47466 [Sphaerobolus stellatus SS14]
MNLRWLRESYIVFFPASNALDGGHTSHLEQHSDLRLTSLYNSKEAGNQERMISDFLNNEILSLKASAEMVESDKPEWAPAGHARFVHTVRPVENILSAVFLFSTSSSFRHAYGKQRRFLAPGSISHFQTCSYPKRMAKLTSVELYSKVLSQWELPNNAELMSNDTSTPGEYYKREIIPRSASIEREFGEN